MAKNLIICPVGMGISHDPRWKSEDHWRLTTNERNYETLVIVYNDFVPEPNTYDHIIRLKGHKWQLMRDIAKVFPTSQYKYVGCVDDDLITDYQSFNKGLELAERFNFQYWQLSMPPDSDLHPSYHQCLKNDPTCDFSETTFIEMGSPFFTLEKYLFLADFLTHWDFKVGMGIDRVWFDMFGCPANVVHCAMIHQPFRESYYDKSEATREMYDFMNNKYREIMKTYYGRDVNFVDQLNVLNKFKLKVK